MYRLPRRTITVFFLTKSRTETRPRTTRVSVDVQRSSTSHLVPTTVAALCLPFVRNLPLPSPHSRRFFLRFAAMLALPAFGQRSCSTSVSVVVGLRALRLPELEHAVVEVGRGGLALVVRGREQRDPALQRVDSGPVGELLALR